MTLRVRAFVTIVSLLGGAACTHRPSAVNSDPISMTARELLECAINKTAGLGFEIRGRARSYQQDRAPGARTYLTELRTLSSDARRAAYDVERACTGAQSPLGVFGADTDVGRARGSVAYDREEQTYLVAGSGENMWDVRDDFHFVWKRVSGNFMLSTRARFIGAGVEAHRKIGWTIRPSLDPGSAHVTAALHGNGLMSLQFRRQTGAITEEEKSADSLPDVEAVILLERRDGDYFMSVARIGDTLVTQRLAGVSLSDTVYVGLFVCSHNATVKVRIKTLPK